MKKVFILLITLCLFITGCKDVVNGVEQPEGSKRFVSTGTTYHIGNTSSTYNVVKDTETGVLYLNYGGYGGITPIVDANGKPLTSLEVPK